MSVKSAGHRHAPPSYRVRLGPEDLDAIIRSSARRNVQRHLVLRRIPSADRNSVTDISYSRQMRRNDSRPRHWGGDDRDLVVDRVELHAGNLTI
jgi:hypothetical protein